MKEIVTYLRKHIESDFKWSIYVYTAIFLIITISINYSLNFEDKILDSYYGSYPGYLFYFIFYAFAYYAIAIPKFIFEKKIHYLKNKKFWIKSLIFLFLIGISGSFYHLNFILKYFHGGDEAYFVLRIINNSKRILLYIIPLIFLKIYVDKDVKGLYGLGAGKFNLRPYFTMLLIMFPLILWASFQSDFLRTYPTLKPWRIEPVFGLSKLQMISIYEFIYGFDFIFVELIFRGALVIGMASILGKDAILPMVTTYAFLHFGKPLGETLGSIFGGYILGVIAYYSKNILGGCIIHIGVALLMELTALFQYYFLNHTPNLYFF